MRYIRLFYTFMHCYLKNHKKVAFFMQKRLTYSLEKYTIAFVLATARGKRRVNHEN